MSHAPDSNPKSAAAEAAQKSSSALEAIVQSAVSLNSNCSFDDADGVLQEAMLRYPQETSLVEQHINLAIQRCDWHGAAERAEATRARFPRRAAAYRYGLQAYCELFRLEEAAALQQQSELLFPEQIWLWIQGAKLAALREETAEAESYWAAVCERFPMFPIGWLERAAFRLQAGRLEAADETLRDALNRFPDDPRIHIYYAQLARPSGLFAEIERRWEAGMLRFPRDPMLARGFAEAPVETPGNHRLEVAVQRYDELHRKFPDFVFGYTRHARLLLRFGDVEGAEKIAATSVATLRSGHNAELSLVLANARERRGDAEGALSIISELIGNLPNEDSAYVALSAVLCRLERFAEADAVCAKAIARFKFRPAPLVEYASVATQQGNHAVALERWNQAARLAPQAKAVCSGLFIARLAIAEQEDAVAGTAMLEIGNEQLRGSVANLMMQFESFGGLGIGGCEFGLVQRNFGAEPIGLLRWATLRTEDLIAALSGRFAGVGLPEQTVVELPFLGSGNAEYFVSDRRFKFQLHTFAMQGEVTESKLHQQWCARLNFFCRKLIGDLESGRKIFLYRPGAVLSRSEIEQLAAAMRSYGENVLLIVQLEDADHRNGTVTFTLPRVMIGYIDRLNTALDGPQMNTPSFSSWARVCSEALALCQEFFDYSVLG